MGARFFENNNYIEEEITWIRTLISLSYLDAFRCTDHPSELQPIAVSEMLDVQMFQLRPTFTDINTIFVSIIYKSLVLKYLNETGILSNEKCF